MIQPIAKVRLRWLTPEEGGRTKPPTGPLYATTARFLDDMEFFSVVLRFTEVTPPNGPPPQEVELTLLAPDRLPDIAERLVPRQRLLITEGPRPVAECEVLSVAKEKLENQVAP